MARVCALDKAEGNGSTAAEVISSEKEVLIVFLKLQYYSYKTSFCAHSQAANWRVLPPCASFNHVTSQWP